MNSTPSVFGGTAATRSGRLNSALNTNHMMNSAGAGCFDTSECDWFVNENNWTLNNSIPADKHRPCVAEKRSTDS